LEPPSCGERREHRKDAFRLGKSLVAGSHAGDRLRRRCRAIGGLGRDDRGDEQRRQRPGTLRAALATAGPGVTITVPAMTITLTSGALHVLSSVTIHGAGARATTVSGGNASGVFCVNAAGAKIEGLTITRGCDNIDFGGVDAASGVTLSHEAIVYNIGTGSGGGVYAYGGPLVIDHSLIAHNRAPNGRGGGICLRRRSGILDHRHHDHRQQPTDEGGGIEIMNSGLLTLDSDTLVETC
jgi:hypothetical protein